MSNHSQMSSRRTVLKLLGSFAVATAGAPQLSAAAKGDFATVKTLRGSKNSPLSLSEIEELRTQLVQRDAPTRESGSPRVVLTDLEETVGDSRVLAYNLILDDSGVPREQFATRDGVADAPGVGTQQADRLHDKADEMLEKARSESGSSGEFSPREDQDDWSEWISYGYTDTVYEPVKGEYGNRPGLVEFKNQVRKDSDADRLGARVRVQMEPGRQICRQSDLNGFCFPSYVEQEGYKNKFSKVSHDWDMSVNNTPTEELITGVDPMGQVSNVTKSRSASIGLDISRTGPAASVGYSSSVTLPGAQLIDATVSTSGEKDHLFEINSPESPSSTNNAVFEVGSAAKWDPNCGGGFNPYNILTVDTELEWGIDAPLITWGDVVSDSKSFTYTTYC